MATKPRGWTGARTPSAVKRVRTAKRRTAINGPRESAAKTYVTKALKVATSQAEGDPQAALADALSALDRAAKAGTIHPNAAARRKSRLTRKVNAALGGTAVQTGSHVAKSTGKAAAQKAAKARVAAAKAEKAKGAQTAAGKARAALSKTARVEAAVAAAAKSAAAAAKTAAPAAPAKATPKKAAGKKPAATSAPAAPAKAAPAAKSTEKPAAKAATKSAAKAPAKKPAAKKPAAKG